MELMYMYNCPGCGSPMIYDIREEQLKCTHCERTESIESADQREAHYADASVGMNLYTCPNCGGTVQALNTAAASFCSYCGSSVMLRQTETQMEAPKGIVPFHVTKEECFAQYQDLLRHSRFVNRRLKKNVTIDSFRGIYVPYHAYEASIKGRFSVEGHKTMGSDTYYYTTAIELNQKYQDILHDASHDMPDSMSERISKIPPTAVKPFSPAYISGFFADNSDTDPRAYMQYVNAQAVRSGVRDASRKLPAGITYNFKTIEENLIRKVEATHTGDILVPFWFMSFRSGNRVLYAIQNGFSGAMAADLPMDFSIFALIALALAVPLFFLFNSFLTLRPEMVLIAAMLLAVAAQLIMLSHRRALAEKLAKDQFSGTRGDDFDTRLRQRKKMEKRESRQSAFAVGGTLGLVIMGFIIHTLSRQDDIGFFTRLAFLLTAVFLIILLLGTKKTVPPTAGSLVTLLVMIAGTVILAANPFHSEDLPMYLVSFLCMGSVVWEGLDLLNIYNRECSNPLPQFETHTGGEDHA